MDSLSTPCIFCGTDRPIASEVCPTCGRGWIDEHLPQPAPPAEPTPPAAAAPPSPTPAAAPPVPPPAVPPPAGSQTTPVADEPSPHTSDQAPQPPSSESVASEAAQAAPIAAAAAAGLTFSDSDDTGHDEDAVPSGEPLLADEPAPTPPAASSDTPVDDEATSMFSAPVVPDPSGETLRPEPPPADEAASVEPVRPTPAEAPPGERPAAPNAANAAGSIDMTPVDPDELGIIPVVQAQGPPAYLPEPTEAGEAAVAGSAADAPAAPAAPTAPDTSKHSASDEIVPDDLPQFVAPEPAAERPEQLGAIPVIPPPSAAEPTRATDGGAPPPPPPAAGQSEAIPGPPPPPPAAPPPTSDPVPPAAGSSGSPLDGPADSAAVAPQPPATPAASASAGGAIDPDGFISDVFAEDLVDGRPPLASDDMLDDDGAWSAFALGGAAAARGAAPPPTPDTSAPEPPSQPAPRVTPTEPAAPSQPPTAPMPAAPAAAASAAGEFGGQHPDESDFFTAPMSNDSGGGRARSAVEAPPSRSRWSQTAIVAAIVLGIVAAWFVMLAVISRDSGDEDPTAATDPDATTPASTAAPETTIASTTSAPTTTLAPTTTVPAIEPVGDPIPLPDLQLGAFALGPIDFGATDGLGRLVASLDQPEAIAAAGVEHGLCPDETGFVAQWGPLSAIFIGSTQTNLLVGYQLGNDPAHPASELTTLSGLQVGDTVAELESTYASLSISYEEIDGQLHFILVRQADSVTLLWGPVTSADADGTVEGIYSPRACDAGPSPSA